MQNNSLNQLEERKVWSIVILLSVFLFALSFQLRGPLLTNIKVSFSASESVLGLTATAGTIGFMFFVLISGMKAGIANIKKLLILGASLTSVASLLMGLAPAFSIFLLATLVAGIGSGIFRGLDKPLLGHLYSEKRGSVYHLYSAVWAIGAMCGPLFANLILGFFDSWRIAYMLIGPAFLPLLILIFKMDIPTDIVQEKPLSWDRLLTITKSPSTIGMATGILLSAGVDGVIFTWLPYYLTQFNSQTVANLALSGYLAAYIPGRLLNSKLSKKVEYTTLVIINSICSALLFTLALILTSGPWIMIAFISAGFFTSVIFPGLLSLGTDLFPTHSGPINALAMTASAIGFAVFPAITGLIAGYTSLRAGMQVPVFLMLSVFVVNLILRKKLPPRKF